MAEFNLAGEKHEVVFGNDSIVIRKYGNSLAGGRVLDVTGYAEKTVLAGHVIITDGNGTYKPMPVDGDAYATLPEGYAYAGVLYRSILAAKPAASILTAGVVNEKALPYAISSIKTAFATACPHIMFESDEPVDTKA